MRILFEPQGGGGTWGGGGTSDYGRYSPGGVPPIMVGIPRGGTSDFGRYSPGGVPPIMVGIPQGGYLRLW